MNHTKVTAGLVFMMGALLLGIAGDFDMERLGAAVVQTGLMIFYGVTR